MASVVIPWRGGDPHRERNLEWVKARYAACFPSWRVICGAFIDGPWCKARAVYPALKSAPDDVVIVADADVWTDGLESAVRAITVGAAEWAVPHKRVYRLDQEATARYLDGAEVRAPLERRAYEGVLGGGIVIAHRDTLLEVPLDPRFEGIDAGHEDEAWGMALNTLRGAPWRGRADLIHLWHPPRPRLSHRRGSLESWEMLRHYLLANGDPQGIQVLLKEAHESYGPDGQTRHNRSSLRVG